MADLQFDTEDFQEEQVWAMMKPRKASISDSKTRKSASSSSSSSSAWRYTATSRTIPRSGSSAPVSIPDWSKIMKEKPKKNLWDDACDVDDGGERRSRFWVQGDEDDDNMLLPPHEYLARRLATTQIASFSMCEGVGRTLKGRDLSKLRNAILTKTGFLE
ncbi:hypothetical protein ACS0TY_032780 [Phlomoides rotata]